MPNRILKESIKSSQQIDSLTWFEEVLYYRLLVSADDYGCMDGRPLLLRNQLFPLKENVTKKAVEDAIDHLASVGLLVKYTASGMPYLLFPTWEKHQRIRNKHRKYPLPDDVDVTDACPSNDGQMTADCLPESESNPNPNPNPIQESTPARHRYGEYGWVQLTEEEHQRLEDELGVNELERCVQYVDESAQASGNKNKWRDWNLVIRKCHREGWGLGARRVSRGPANGLAVQGKDPGMKQYVEALKHRASSEAG